MTASTALVGPVSRVWFVDGSFLPFTPPRDTCDIRYAACREHRTACDCREAQFAERVREQAMELREINAVIGEVLKGHPTFAPVDFLDAFQDVADESGPVCRCTGCVIVRDLYRRHVATRSPSQQWREARGESS
jgi:hypothetical protein